MEGFGLVLYHSVNCIPESIKLYVMLGLHYIPGGHGSPGSPKRSAP